MGKETKIVLLVGSLSLLSMRLQSKKTLHQLQKLFSLPTLVLSAHPHLLFSMRHKGKKENVWREDKVNKWANIPSKTPPKKKKGTILSKAKAALGDKPTEHYPSFYSSKHTLPKAISHLSLDFLPHPYSLITSTLPLINPSTWTQWISHTAFLSWTMRLGCRFLSFFVITQNPLQGRGALQLYKSMALGHTPTPI